MARVRESGRGSGVEVTEQDHDDDRERVKGVISSAARSQHDRGSNLHPRCRTGGVSSLGVPIYTPNHTSTYSPEPAKDSDRYRFANCTQAQPVFCCLPGAATWQGNSRHRPKSLHINQISTQHATPRCRNWVQGGDWGATHRKTPVLRWVAPLRIFLAGRPPPRWLAVLRWRGYAANHLRSGPRRG